MVEPLFTKTKKMEIITYDLFGKKHKKNLKDFRFRISVYGILLEGERILLQRHPLINKFCLPGGGVELGETISDSLKREFWEETGIKVKIMNLIDVSQDFFTHEGKCAHSVLIFYKVKKVGGNLTINNEDSVEVKYFKLSELDKNNVQRVFLPIIKKIERD